VQRTCSCILRVFDDCLINLSKCSQPRFPLLLLLSLLLRAPCIPLLLLQNASSSLLIRSSSHLSSRTPGISLCCNKRIESLSGLAWKFYEGPPIDCETSTSCLPLPFPFLKNNPMLLNCFVFCHFTSFLRLTSLHTLPCDLTLAAINFWR
jgi:hypothetical protein